MYEAFTLLHIQKNIGLLKKGHNCIKMLLKKMELLQQIYLSSMINENDIALLYFLLSNGLSPVG